MFKRKILLISKNKNKKKVDYKLLNYVPNILKFILYFIYIIIFHLKFSLPKQTRASIVFFDIFTHIDFRQLNKKNFKTGYWQNLPSLLKKNFPFNIDWQHLFYSQKETKFLNNAVSNANSISDNKNNHNIIDIITLKDLFLFSKNIVSFI